MKQPNLVHIQGILSKHFAAKGDNCQCRWCESFKMWHDDQYPGGPCKRCGYTGLIAMKISPHGIGYCPVCGSEGSPPIPDDDVMEIFRHCRDLIQFILFQKKELAQALEDRERFAELAQRWGAEVGKKDKYIKELEENIYDQS